MGACFNTKSYPIEMSKQTVEKEFRDYQNICAYDRGHEYSGQLNMCPGLQFVDKTFDSYDEACDWIAEHQEKWEAAIAVRTKDQWVIGGWCAE